MALMIFIYVAATAFVIGNFYRIVRIARMPAHLRWELYPMPKGTRTQQRYGGSYFEQTEWWSKPRERSWPGELAYIVREVFCFKTLWQGNRRLWLWSWLLHIGLYSLVVSGAVTVAAAASGAAMGGVVRWTADIAVGAGMAGSLGLLAMRIANPRLRPFSTRLDIFNLLLMASIFGTGSAALVSDAQAPEHMIAFVRSLFGTARAPELNIATTIHLAVLGVFLAYFPATHMTHAYMKFFTYHRVRWDDRPVVHDTAMADAMSENMQRPISWAAPHIAGSGPTWSAVVARADEEARR
jgi:nitrate reductase gamma subunit